MKGNWIGHFRVPSASAPKRVFDRAKPRLHFRRSLGSGLRSSPKRDEFGVRSGEERGLVSRTAVGNRAYAKQFICKMCSAYLFPFYANQTHVHMKGFARRFVLKQMHKVIWKWPIIFPYIFSTFSFAKSPSRDLQITVCTCVIASKCVLQIKLCSCVIVTILEWKMAIAFLIWKWK